jgi:FkbM family methyltransferase
MRWSGFFTKPVPGRMTLRGALRHIKRLGFEPETVLDVGAAAGTEALYETFPKAYHILIEPLEEYRPSLDRVVKRYERAEVVTAAAYHTQGEVTIHVHPDLMGSSLYLEDEDSDVNGLPRVVKAVTLDRLCGQHSLEGPYLIKLDVQGAELDVLKGSERVLENTEYVVVESSLFRFFKNGPQWVDLILFMKDRGFVVYDLLDPQYRPLDGAMSQTDLAFVKETGFFRKSHSYATREQREIQNKRLKKGRRRMGEESR